jgi:oxygen-independent coproporphyrinogen-3 oxidase
VAQKAGTLRRNFQGYTDDTAPALIGLGASSISRFPQGFAQNASATAAHTQAIRAGRFSTHRGHAFAGEDLLRARIIEALMCDFRVDRAELVRDYGVTPARVDTLFRDAAAGFEDMVQVKDGVFLIPEKGRPLTRMVARAFDAYDQIQGAAFRRDLTGVSFGPERRPARPRPE